MDLRDSDETFTLALACMLAVLVTRPVYAHDGEHDQTIREWKLADGTKIHALSFQPMMTL